MPCTCTCSNDTQWAYVLNYRSVAIVGAFNIEKMNQIITKLLEIERDCAKD